MEKLEFGRKDDCNEATAGLNAKFPAPSHVIRTIDRTTVVIATGHIVAVLLTHQISPELCTEVEKAPNWRLWNTAFTSIHINKNLRSAYHVDSGNLKGVMSAMMPIGKFIGGELVLARWRIALAYKPGDLLLFNPQELHGNLPFEGERLSAIFYSAGGIAKCGK